MGTESPSKMGIIFKVMAQGYVFTIVHWKQHFKYQWNLNNIANLSKWVLCGKFWGVGGGDKNSHREDM